MKNRSRRGGALIEFAIALPFSVTLFLGIGDFGLYFWRLTQMEEAVRFAVSRVNAAPAAYAAADEPALLRYASQLENDVRLDSGYPEIAVTLSRQFACPSSTGSEDKLSPEPQLCQGERVYLQIAGEHAVSPLLQPLAWMGFPKSALSRHFLRIR